jgi:hypothetical protein
VTSVDPKTAPPAPQPITTNPYVGIQGVFLGAGIATLNARLVSVGLPDLRGALGVGIDEASWIPTALNMATATSPLSYLQLNAIHGPSFQGWYCMCVVWLKSSSWSMRKTPGAGKKGMAPAWGGK